MKIVGVVGVFKLSKTFRTPVRLRDIYRKNALRRACISLLIPKKGVPVGFFPQKL